MRLSAPLLLAGCAVAATALWSQRLPSRSRSAVQPVRITFNNQIVRIFQKHCQVCHHPGDVGPFSLMSYSESRPWARRIKDETQARRMPPWKPVAGFGEFHGERRPTQPEIDLIAGWVEAGAPEGDPGDLPQPLSFSIEWRLGTPDLVLEPEADFRVPAQGRDAYRCFSIPTRLLRSQWVSGFEVQPGNRAIVHHVLLYPDRLALSAFKSQNDNQTGYNCFGGPGVPFETVLGAWAPGAGAQTYPEGAGILLTPFSRVVMQVHYHLDGKAQSDRTRVGIYFGRQGSYKEVLTLPVVNSRFVIPAGAERHVVTASFTVPPLVSGRAISVLPHMHLLGREIKAQAVFPDGAVKPLIYIDDWDFQWQGVYYYREPVLLTPGTRIEVTAIYDNSAGNPRNPNDPPLAVRWGEQTTDEMCLVGFGVILD